MNISDRDIIKKMFETVQAQSVTMQTYATIVETQKELIGILYGRIEMIEEDHKRIIDLKDQLIEIKDERIEILTKGYEQLSGSSIQSGGINANPRSR